MDKLTQYRPELGVYVRVAYSIKLSMMATIFEFDRLNHTTNILQVFTIHTLSIQGNSEIRHKFK